MCACEFPCGCNEPWMAASTFETYRGTGCVPFRNMVPVHLRRPCRSVYRVVVTDLSAPTAGLDPSSSQSHLALEYKYVGLGELPPNRPIHKNFLNT